MTVVNDKVLAYGHQMTNGRVKPARGGRAGGRILGPKGTNSSSGEHSTLNMLCRNNRRVMIMGHVRQANPLILAFSPKGEKESASGNWERTAVSGASFFIFPTEHAQHSTPNIQSMRLADGHHRRGGITAGAGQVTAVAGQASRQGWSILATMNCSELRQSPLNSGKNKKIYF